MSTRDIKKYQIGGSVGYTPTYEDSLALYKASENQLARRLSSENEDDLESSKSFWSSGGTVKSPRQFVSNPLPNSVFDAMEWGVSPGLKDLKAGYVGMTDAEKYDKYPIKPIGYKVRDSNNYSVSELRDLEYAFKLKHVNAGAPVSTYNTVMNTIGLGASDAEKVRDFVWDDDSKAKFKSSLTSGKIKTNKAFSTYLAIYPKPVGRPQTLGIIKTITPFVRSNPNPKRSVADNLKAMGKDSSYSTRKQMFIDAGLGDTYEGNADENVKLNEWLHAGGLDKPAVVEGSTGFKRSVKPMNTDKTPTEIKTIDKPVEKLKSVGGYKKIRFNGKVPGTWDVEYRAVDNFKPWSVDHVASEDMTEEMLKKVVGPSAGWQKPSFRLGGPVVLRNLITKTRL